MLIGSETGKVYNDTSQTVHEKQMLNAQYGLQVNERMTAEKHLKFNCVQNAVMSDSYTKLELHLKGAPIGYIVVLNGFVDNISEDFDVEIIR